MDDGEFTDQFISIASHELKNPLAALRGYAELLLRRIQQTDDERTTRGLRTILQQALRMQWILDDLHEISRLHRNLLQLKLQRLNVRHLLEQAAKAYGWDGVVRPVNLTLPDPAIEVDGDAERLLLLLDRLIGVAYQHLSPGATIQLAGRLAGNELLITISFAGGLPISEIMSAFESFYQPQGAASINATERIGLYLSAQLSQLHGGSLTIAQGSFDEQVFQLALPIAAS